jgi:hypothetical protein
LEVKKRGRKEGDNGYNILSARWLVSQGIGYLGGKALARNLTLFILWHEQHVKMQAFGLDGDFAQLLAWHVDYEQLLAALPSEQRDFLYWYYVEQLNFRDAAEAMGISERKACYLGSMAKLILFNLMNEERFAKLRFPFQYHQARLYIEPEDEAA